MLMDSLLVQQHLIRMHNEEVLQRGLHHPRGAQPREGERRAN